VTRLFFSFLLDSDLPTASDIGKFVQFVFQFFCHKSNSRKPPSPESTFAPGMRAPATRCDISSGVAQRVVNARSGPRLKGMGILDIEKDALSLKLQGFS
jgi:hypothetical protein